MSTKVLVHLMIEFIQRERRTLIALSQGILQQDNGDKFYLYRQVMGSHYQIGIVAVASIDAYEQNLIKKHEFTRPDKEDDRVHHMEALGAQVGPVLLTYKAEAEINKLAEQIVATTPECDFEADDKTLSLIHI